MADELRPPTCWTRTAAAVPHPPSRRTPADVHGRRPPSSSELDSRRRRAPSSSAPDSRRRGPRPRPHRTPAAAGPRPSRRASEEEEAATEEEDGGPPPHSSAIPPNTEAHGSVLRARGRKCCECRFGIENEFEFQCLNHPNSGIWCYPMPIPIPKPQYIHPNLFFFSCLRSVRLILMGGFVLLFSRVSHH